MPGNLKPDANALPDLQCACANLRRAARLVTQLYSREMGREIEPAQFSLLSVLSHRPGASQAPLGRALGLDKTTMSRNLRLMQRNGWIEPALTDDQRERGFRLTPGGAKILSATRPGWLRAQAKLRTALKPGEWETMLKVFGRVAEAALAARQDLHG
jgi:DNA-binding MarR family transcriptional regulator